MQIKLTFRPDRPLIIPFNYNYQLQSAIYAMLGEVGQSEFWHDNGFGETDKFKGFCFGKLEGKYKTDLDAKKIYFENNIYLEVRSPSFDFIDSFQRALEQHPYIKLYNTKLYVTNAFLTNVHLTEGNTKLFASTPIIVSRTLPDGRKYYLSPEEDEFYIGICNNFVKKYEAINNEPAPNLNIRPCGEFKKTVTRYKNMYLTGYTGTIEVKSDIKTKEFIYNTGFGAKNSQGFGFVKAIKD